MEDGSVLMCTHAVGFFGVDKSYNYIAEDEIWSTSCIIQNLTELVMYNKTYYRP